MGQAHSLDSLLAAEKQLDRTFMACVCVYVLTVVWPVYLQATDQSALSWAVPVARALVLVLFAAYVWFAVAVGKAAEQLARPRGLYVAWILVAPILGMFIPLVGVVIQASPLSLKFMLSGQLRSEIHDLTFEQ